MNAEGLLNIAYQTFVQRTHLLDVLSDEKWYRLGFEYWMQTELIVALADRGYGISIEGKQKRHCDLMVKDEDAEVEIELKCSTQPFPEWLKDVFKWEKELYLFLSKSHPEREENYSKDFEAQGYFVKKVNLNSKWIVMVVAPPRKSI